ncbi:cartilage intermediate layer protein 1-like [Oculina patagonica]
MAPASEESNAKGNKYVVNVKPSSTPNRRFLVLILAAAALVIIVVLLATLIPIHVTGNGEDKSNEKLSDRQRGDDFHAKNSTGPSIKGVSTFRRHFFTSVSTIDTLTSKHEEGPSFQTTNTSPSEMISPSMAIRATESRLESVSSSNDCVRSSAKQTRASSLQQGKTSPLPKETSLTTATSRTGDTPILSSVSAISSTSSIAGLSVIAKLVPNTESKWSRWSSWNDCTKTCGTGTRQRTRTCVAINQRAVFAPISCAGKTTEKSSCAEWSCPDCSKTCTIGTLNAACDACTCDQHVLTGRVLTEDDAPLLEANISLVETPYTILAQTNASGFFTTLGVCAGQQELLVTKAGFVPVRKNATTATITFKMEIAVPPFITVHPESKIRMPGQSVTFCCDGEGNPSPEIEWFKDNNIIDKDLYSYNKTLEISDTRGLNGSYRCRAVNMFGAEFSEAASLDVLELSQDSCSPTPSSKNVTLPPGCVISGTNTSTVDVGECEPVKCLKDVFAFKSSCQDPSFCCGPRNFSQVLVDCGDIISFNLSIVTHCSCGSCKEKVTTVQGIVVGGPQEKPIRYGNVIYNGEKVARTNRKGQFSFTIPGKVIRAIVTLKDSYYNVFEEKSKIFVINKGSSDFHKIKLNLKPSPIVFNASEPLDIPLGSDPSDNFADLELPEETFLTEDGSVYKGNAKAMVSVTDPRNLSDVLNAPGDFSTTDEEGEEEILETYGMVKLNFEDESGKKLVISKPMKVFLDPEKLNLTFTNSSDVLLKLYWLDKKTQRWREVGNFHLEDGSKRRRKRSNRVFFAVIVTPAIPLDQTLNFDLPTIRVAVRVVAERENTAQGVPGVAVRVLRKQGMTYGGYAEKTTDNYGVACIPIWRDANCTLQAEHSGFYIKPVKTENLPNTAPYNIEASPEQKVVGSTTIQWIDFKSVLFSVNSGVNSPMYKHIDGEVTKCKSQQRPKGAQFTFKVPQNNPSVFSMLTTTDDWIHDDCYIKIKVNGENAIFVAESYKGHDLTENIGLHLQMSQTVTAGSGTKIVCLTFSCPIVDGTKQTLTLDEDQSTFVKIAPLTRRCTFKSVHPDLGGVQPPDRPGGVKTTEYERRASPPAITGQARWFWIPRSTSGQTFYKTFRGNSNGKYGKEKCLNGNQNYSPSSSGTVTTTDTGYALEYDCS